MCSFFSFEYPIYIYIYIYIHIQYIYIYVYIYIYMCVCVCLLKNSIKFFVFRDFVQKIYRYNIFHSWKYNQLCIKIRKTSLFFYFVEINKCILQFVSLIFFTFWKYCSLKFVPIRGIFSSSCK